MLTNSVFADINSSPIAALEGRSLRSLRAGSSVSEDWRSHFTNTQAQRIGSGAGMPSERGALDPADHVVDISPRDAVTRRTVISDGITAEIVQATSQDRFESRFRAPVHLLVVYEQGVRRDGDTFVEGLSRSTLRDFARKLTFVPAGHEYREWQDPRSPTHLMYVYFDPAQLQVPSDASAGDAVLSAKLFFEDATLLDTALKLKRSLESPTSENHLYLEALGVVLAHELIRFNRRTPASVPQLRGGLAAWQRRIVTAHIEAHLSETIPLAGLAQLARLSPYYFCRAFKQSFGVPPHRYHTNRRIEHAKGLLAMRTHSVTDIGLTVGYSETSSFTAAFRKVTGVTPSAYQRSLG
jgi:AraC family transcriptional regulator